MSVDPARSPKWGWVTRASIALLVVVPPLVTDRSGLEDYTRLVVLVLAVLGVSVLTGATGLISLGHAVFVGIGAFSMANLLDAGLAVPLALLIATLAGAVAGTIVAVPAFRVRGPYLALITFGLAVMFPPISRRLGGLTGAALGRNVDITGFRPPSFLGLDERIHIWNYSISVVVVAVWFLLARNLLESRMGRAVRAMKDHEYAAAAFGINLRTAKTGIFAVSAAMAATAGALQAIVDPYLNGSSYGWDLSLRLYISAVIGGLGSLVGAVVGVAALVLIPVANTALGLLQDPALVFGCGLLVVILAAPDGVVGLFRRR